MIQLKRKRPLCLLALLFVVLLFLVKYFWAAHPGEDARSEGIDKMQDGIRITVSGKLVQKETKSGSLICYLNNIQIISPQGVYQNNFPGQNFICYIDGAQEIAVIGCNLTVQGIFYTFDSSENEGQFDAKNYYALSGYSGSIHKAEILSVSGDKDMLSELLYRWKNGAKNYLMQHMTEENAGVLAAMLLGEKKDMDAEIKSLYQKSGIAHILAISGLHISLLGMGLYGFLRRLRVKPMLCCLLSGVIVLLYGKMTGGTSSVTRACCMFVLILMADVLERSYDLLTGLAFSAFIVLIKNPDDLSNAGFLLSFMAILGIALIGNIFADGKGTEDGRRGRVKKLFKKYVGSPLMTSVSVQLMTLPVMLWFYYTISPYAVLLNLIVVPLMSGILLGGAAALFVRVPLLLYLPAALLNLIEFICRICRRLPGWQVVIGRPKVWQIIVYYLMLFCLLWAHHLWKQADKGMAKRILKGERGKRQNKGEEERQRQTHSGKQAWICVLGLLCNCVILLLPARRMDAIDMLSVGQGDCIVLRTKEGNCVISDGGSSSVSQAGTYRLVPYLKYNGIRHVDAVFLSHAHSDHCSALLELFEQAGDEGISVSYLIMGSVAKDNDRYQKIRDAALACGSRVCYMQTDDTVSFGRLKMTCLYESGTEYVADENDESMVIYASLSDLTILLTGDSTQESDDKVLDALKKRKITAVTCLKAAHHGARTANSERLLADITPKIALISCGRDNSYGHPHEETIRRLSDIGTHIYVTKDLGQIRIRDSRRGWVIENYPFREW